MPKPFKKKTFRDKLEGQLSDLAEQTDELRKQVVDRAPGVRDQIVEQTGELRKQVVDQTGELRKQVVDRAPGVRDQIVSHLPDREQLLDLRDDLFDRLPDSVQEKLPEQVKPKRKRLRKVAAIGVLTGAGAAAFAILKRRGSTEQAYVAPPAPPKAPTPPAAPAAPATTTAPPTAASVLDDVKDGVEDLTDKAKKA